MLSWWEAVILGLVEGITEYLPISSTGHLVLTTALLPGGASERREALNAFVIVIQGGAILAVLGLYAVRVKQMVLGLVGRDKAGLKLAVNLVVAFVPAAILGVLFAEAIDRWLMRPWPVLGALVLGGVYMIGLDALVIRPRDRAAAAASASESGEGVERSGHAGIDITELTPMRALVIGLFQVVAMWPGTSRSMMTITAGVIVGLRPRQAAEFSFLLGLPTLGGATVYKLYQNLDDSARAGTPNLFEQLGIWPVVIGVVVATISAALAVKWLVSFLARHGLTPFGWYRIGLAAVLGALMWMGVVRVEAPGAVEGAESGVAVGAE